MLTGVEILALCTRRLISSAPAILWRAQWISFAQKCGMSTRVLFIEHVWRWTSVTSMGGAFAANRTNDVEFDSRAVPIRTKSPVTGEKKGLTCPRRRLEMDRRRYGPLASEQEPLHSRFHDRPLGAAHPELVDAL